VGNVAGELDTLGRSEKRELRSRLGVLLLHLLKWLHQPMHQCTSCRLIIEEQWDAIVEVVASNPSLEPSQAVKDAYKQARRNAIIETGLRQSTFPLVCPWSPAQVLDSRFHP
jgi:Domain of unknown function DUF29